MLEPFVLGQSLVSIDLVGRMLASKLRTKPPSGCSMSQVRMLRVCEAKGSRAQTTKLARSKARHSHQ